MRASKSSMPSATAARMSGVLRPPRCAESRLGGESDVVAGVQVGAAEVQQVHGADDQSPLSGYSPFHGSRASSASREGGLPAATFSFVARPRIRLAAAPGAVAMRLAVTHGDRVSHLVLVNSLTAESTPAPDVRALQRNTARYVLRVATGILGVAPLLTPVLERSVADRAHMPWRLVARYLAPYVGQDGVRHLLALAASVTADDLEGVDPAAVAVLLTQ